MIREELKKSLTQARKNQDKLKIKNLTIVLGEFERGTEKEISDETAIKVMKKLTKFAKETSDTELIDLMKQYVPEDISEEEVLKWINENVNFSELKNKMQAVGLVMKNFQGKVDGELVKNLIQNMG